MTEPNDESRVPVTILTGYLGAGKTTLLNRILTERHGLRIAVIENEFGEIGIDNDLVVNADEEIFEMNNGCICCTVRGDLIRILGNLMSRRDRFDYVLVETTGLADPAPVVQTFFVDDEMKDRLRLDGVVTVVDAHHLAAQIDRSPECREQIAFADVVILNKADTVGAADLAAAERRISAVNRFARIHRSVRCDVPVESVVDIRSFDLTRALEIDPAFLSETAHQHDETVTSVGIEIEGDLDSKRLESWIGSLLRDKGTDIFRMKGILAVAGMPEQFVFQGVHMLFDRAAGPLWGAKPRVSRMVFIGRGLDRAEIDAGFRGCLAGGRRAGR